MVRCNPRSSNGICQKYAPEICRTRGVCIALKWETDFYPVPVLGRIALSMRFPDRSPVLDKYRALMGPEILSSTGAGVCRKAPKAFPDSRSVLDKFQSAKKIP